MMKQPTTKKLSEKQVRLAVDFNGNPYKKLFPDEKFYQFPGYPKVFVSQYDTILSTSGKFPHQLKPYPSRDYLKVKLCKRGKTEQFYVHQIVAAVWLEKPTFTLDTPLEVHHNKKVRKYSTIDVNFAENLQYVYKPYHKILDSTKSMKVKTPTGKYKYMKEVRQIAEYYHVTEYSVYELLRKPPKDIIGNTAIYIDGHIEIQVKKYKE